MKIISLFLIYFVLVAPTGFVEASSGGHIGFLGLMGILFLLLIFIMAVLFFGGQGDIVENIMRMILDKFSQLDKNKENEEKNKNTIDFTYPAGKSVSVFESGWMFGAKVVADGVDVSDEVKWSGTGSFQPEIGMRSRPSFSSVGSNTITISYHKEKISLSKTITVNAVSSEGYAKVGDYAKCPADAHGCPACPHSVSGPITTGSSIVLIGGRPAARQGDVGTHAACCKSNTYKITGATGEVIINGKQAAKRGDQTTHCGGVGRIE